MGWGYGTVQGKEVGYTVDTTCEHLGCTATINRGLSYACGNDHGEDEVSCAGYFCDNHLSGWARQPWAPWRDVCVCAECAVEFRKNYPAVAQEIDAE